MSDHTPPDALGIYWWCKSDGTIGYRCRGIGAKYTKFYREWIPTTSYRSTGDDWPWDFFVFDDPRDHARLIKDFSNDVFEDKINE